jgi:hypothetical protein
MPSAAEVFSSLWIAARRLLISLNNLSPSSTRAVKSPDRSASTPVTPFAWSRSSPSALSREATVREIFDRPLMDARTSEGESSKVVEMVSSALASCSVSTSSVVVVRSLNACTTS